MTVYEVQLTVTFDAEHMVDAVDQMTAYVVDYARRAGYRVTDLDKGTSAFFDAENLSDYYCTDCGELVYPNAGGELIDSAGSAVCDEGPHLLTPSVTLALKAGLTP